MLLQDGFFMFGILWNLPLLIMNPSLIFLLYFSNLGFGDLLKNESPSPIAGIKSYFVLPTPVSLALLMVDENIPRQVKKFSKIKQ